MMKDRRKIQQNQSIYEDNYIIKEHKINIDHIEPYYYYYY